MSPPGVGLASQQLVAFLGQHFPAEIAQGAAVEARAALEHYAVAGHALAGLDHHMLAHLYAVHRDKLLRAAVVHDVGEVLLAADGVKHRVLRARAGVIYEDAAYLVQQQQRRALNVRAEAHGENGGQGQKYRPVQVLAFDDAQNRAGQDVIARDDGREYQQHKRPRFRYALHEQGHGKRGAGDDEPYYEQDVKIRLPGIAGRSGVGRAAAAA